MNDQLTGTERIDRELARLGADAEPPEGWEARVLSAIADERIDCELSRLGGEAEPPEGWEVRVLSAISDERIEPERSRFDPEIDRRADSTARVDANMDGGRAAPVLVGAENPKPRRRRSAAGEGAKWRWQVAIPVLAAAALALFIVIPKRQSPMLAVEIEHVGEATLAPPTPTSATIGDVAHMTFSGEGSHRALWVYRDDRVLVVACPGDTRCRETKSALALAVTLDTIAVYRLVALTSNSPIPLPHGGYDQDVAAALSAGAERTTRSINVR